MSLNLQTQISNCSSFKEICALLPEGPIQTKIAWPGYQMIWMNNHYEYFDVSLLYNKLFKLRYAPPLFEQLELRLKKLEEKKQFQINHQNWVKNNLAFLNKEIEETKKSIPEAIKAYDEEKILATQLFQKITTIYSQFEGQSKKLYCPMTAFYHYYYRKQKEDFNLLQLIYKNFL